MVPCGHRRWRRAWGPARGQATGGHSREWGTYLPPGLVVVQVHERPRILLNLPGIHKDFGEPYPVSDVSRAASPFPSFLLVVLSLFFFVTTAVAQVSLRAGSRDRMGYSSSNDGIRERRFSAT